MDFGENTDLVVASGSTLNLPARSYKYKSITIEGGGILQITPRSRQWLLLFSEGNVEISGAIIFKEFYFPPNGSKPPASSRSALANFSLIFSPEF